MDPSSGGNKIVPAEDDARSLLRDQEEDDESAPGRVKRGKFFAGPPQDHDKTSKQTTSTLTAEGGGPAAVDKVMIVPSSSRPDPDKEVLDYSSRRVLNVSGDEPNVTDDDDCLDDSSSIKILDDKEHQHDDDWNHQEDGSLTTSTNTNSKASLFHELFSALVASRKELLHRQDLVRLRAFPDETVLKPLELKLKEACDVLGIAMESTIIDLLRRVFAIGIARKAGSTYLDMLVDMAVLSESILIAETILNVTLSIDPECFRALCELFRIQARGDTNTLLLQLKRIIQVGDKKGLDVLNYKYLLAEREGPARNLSHAVQLAAFQYANQLKREFPGAQIIPNTRTKELQVLLSFESNQTPSMQRTYEIDSYVVKVRFYESRSTPLVVGGGGL